MTKRGMATSVGSLTLFDGNVGDGLKLDRRRRREPNECGAKKGKTDRLRQGQ